MTNPDSKELHDISADMRFWRRLNEGNPAMDAAPGYLAQAEEALIDAYFDLDPEYKLQLIAGEKAIALFSFNSGQYRSLDVQGAFADQNLQPGEAMDLAHMHEKVFTQAYPIHRASLYMGHVLFANSMDVAEAVSTGGSLQIVPQDAEDTHINRILARSAEA